MNQRNIAKFLLVSASFLTIEVSVAHADQLAQRPAQVVASQTRSTTQAPQRYEGPFDQRTIDPREFQRR